MAFSRKITNVRTLVITRIKTAFCFAIVAQARWPRQRNRGAVLQDFPLNFYLRTAILLLLLVGTLVGQEVVTRFLLTHRSESDDTAIQSGNNAHRVVLKWVACATPGIAGYYVYRADRKAGAHFKRITPNPIQGTEYTDVDVKPGRSYVYAVRTVKVEKSHLIESDLTGSIVAHVPR